MKIKSVAKTTENYQDMVKRLNKKNAILSGMVIILLIFSLALLLLSGYLGSQVKRVPYVIELTSDGKATYYENAVKLLEDYTPSTITQKYFIMHYVINMRTVSSDNFVNIDNVDDVCSKTTGSAIQGILDFYTQYNPIDRSENVIVNIPTEEIGVVQYSTTKWKLTWRETTYRKSDKAVLSDVQYEGIFDVAFYTPKTEQDLEKNPIGMYVTQFDIDYVRSLI